MPVDIDYFEGTLFPYAEPAHVLNSIPFEKLIESDQIREPKVVLGKYHVKKIVPGEKVEYESEPNKRSNIKTIVYSLVPTSSVVEAVKSHSADIYYNVPASDYETVAKENGYEFLGRESLQYSYIGFKEGYYDSLTGMIKANHNKKINNQPLRQAMGYALDNKKLISNVYNGLRKPADSLILPMFKGIHEEKLGYSYQPEKAKELLDKAGYKDKNEDGYREDPSGKELVLHLGMIDSDSSAKVIADYYMQMWKAIGIHVELANNRLYDGQAFAEQVLSNTKEFDLFVNSNQISRVPYQNELFSNTAMLNLTGFTSKKNTELLEKMNQNDLSAFEEWQRYMMSEAFVIPTFYKTDTLLVDKKIANFSYAYSDYTWDQIIKK